MRLFLKEICERLFSFSISISQIYSLRAMPLVYLRRKRFPMAMIANSTKKLIGLMPLRLRYPRQMGLEVEASVPTAETMPAPIPLAREGYSSQKQTWKKQKKNETQPLNMKTMMISKILWMQRSHSSGFSMKVSRRAQTPEMVNMIMPVILLGIFSMRKKEGTKVTNSDRLTRQLLTYMSKPISSMMSAGPQYIAQVMKEMMLHVIVMTLRLENLQRSMGVMYLSLKSQVIWQSMTFWMCQSSRILSYFLFMRPIRFRAFFVTATPFFSKNCGVYSMQKIRSSNSMMAGTATRQIQLILHESITEKKKVIIIAPNVKKICTNTEYFCLLSSPTTSPKKKKQILMAASQPHPLKKSPTATMQIFTLQATMIVPIVQMPQETTIDDFLPKLSEKKEMAMYPMNAPKQVQLLTRSIMADLLHRQLSSVAREVKSRSSGSMNSCHCSSGSSHTQSAQSESESNSPCALQSNEYCRKRKAVLRRMMPVTNQQMRKMATINC